MEVCGGQTHSIIRFGIDQLLPPQIRLIHGPGCPVCVTAIEVINRAIEIAALPGVILCSFGDMLRVPGTQGDLMTAKARGDDVRIVYSPLDAVTLAAKTPDRQVVFFGVGFETTAPANGMAIYQAARGGLPNFSALTSHVLVPPALVAVLGSPHNQVQGFLAAGHVCTIMGYKQYEPISEKYRVPIVVTGFEPLDILQGIYLCVRQLENGKAHVENQYARSVNRDGNATAQELLTEVFEVSRKSWRGLGAIPESGLRLRAKYAPFDANLRFPIHPDRACHRAVALHQRPGAPRVKNPPNARSSGDGARQKSHSAPRWFRGRALVPPTTATGRHQIPGARIHDRTG